MEENREVTTGAEPIQAAETEEKKKFRINAHIVFAAVVGISLILLISKFIGFGRHITRDEIDSIPVPDHPEIETYDHIVPNLLVNDGTWPEDDGVTTVVCLGNAPFSDDRNSPNNICNLFAEKTGAVVYNCAVPDSYLAACESTFIPNAYPRDAFSFYFLTTAFTRGDGEIFEQAYQMLGSRPKEVEEPLSLLMSIDFTTVDVIYIMYDGTDYMFSRKLFPDTSCEEPQYSNGALLAGLKLIQESFPWIRIIVMSPTYAYAVQEDGSYASSDKVTNGQDFALALYFFMEYEAAYSMEITFIDNFYGAIHEDIASDYLKDNIHLNQAGRELIADRMQEALETYTSLY